MVFCKDCKYFDLNNDIMEKECRARPVLKTFPTTQCVIYPDDPDKKNKNNDCPDFVKKKWYQ